MGTCSSKTTARVNIDQKLKHEVVYQSKLDKAVVLSKKRYGEINWLNILKYNQFSEADILCYKNTIDWSEVSRYQRLTSAFITKYANRIDFDRLSDNPYLTEDLIEDFINELSISCIVQAIKTRKLSTSTMVRIIQKYHKPYYANLAFEYYEFSEATLEMLMRLYRAEDTILQHQRLSEAFMNKHKKRWNWDVLSQYQRMSIHFLESNKPLINWRKLSYSKHLTPAIAIAYQHLLVNTEEVERALLSGRLHPITKEKSL